MLKKYKFSIELKSDLCASSGDTFGTFVDTDICYDENGLPYIPSKRLKGCLRENAYEFLKWQKVVEEQDLDCLFGMPGKNESGKLRINNAYIENYDIISENLNNIKEEDKKYLSKQRMINLFTYVRYQTAIEDETGVSKKNSLRTIRAVKRGNSFIATIEVDYKDEKEKEIENYLENIVKTITHIGSNRTRGFGEIECVLSDITKEEKSDTNKEQNSNAPQEEYNTIKILFKADSDIIVSKQNTEVSESYIPGSNILGNIAKKYVNEHGKEITDEYIKLFLNGNVKYSNAYISNKENKEFYPVPFSYAKVKNTNDRFHNKMYDVEETGIQLSTLTDKFVTLDNDNYMETVKMNENLHHQRPEDDKSLGHASEGKGAFYQFVAIKKGQYFWSKIVGTTENLNIIRNLINEKDIFYVGKSRTAEYGKLVVEKIKIENNNQNTNNYNHFAVLLTSDAIVLDDKNSLASNNKEVLIAKIKNLLNIKDENIMKNNSEEGTKIRKTREFINYGKASGYNIIWNLPKEQQDVFSAGSILEFNLKESIPLYDEYYIGQRQAEGFGNIKIINLDAKSSVLELKKCEKLNENMELSKELKDLYVESLKNVICEDILKYIQETFKNELVLLNNTTIGRVLLMLKQSANSEAFMKNINEIKDDKKLEKVQKVLGTFNIKELDSVKKLMEIDPDVLNNELIENYKMFYYKNCFEIIKVEGGKN